jgi:hypothetical protein
MQAPRRYHEASDNADDYNYTSKVDACLYIATETTSLTSLQYSS